VGWTDLKFWVELKLGATVTVGCFHGLLKLGSFRLGSKRWATSSAYVHRIGWRPRRTAQPCSATPCMSPLFYQICSCWFAKPGWQQQP